MMLHTPITLESVNTIMLYILKFQYCHDVANITKKRLFWVSVDFATPSLLLFGLMDFIFAILQCAEETMCRSFLSSLKLQLYNKATHVVQYLNRAFTGWLKQMNEMLERLMWSAWPSISHLSSCLLRCLPLMSRIPLQPELISLHGDVVGIQQQYIKVHTSGTEQ